MPAAVTAIPPNHALLCMPCFASALFYLSGALSGLNSAQFGAWSAFFHVPSGERVFVCGGQVWCFGEVVHLWSVERQTLRALAWANLIRKAVLCAILVPRLLFCWPDYFPCLWPCTKGVQQQKFQL